MFSEEKDILDSIPMPGSAPPSSTASDGNTAWEKAQQALKKIVAQTPPSTGISQPPPPTSQPLNAHAVMMQYYPWIVQQYGMQYPPPPNYVMGYQQQSYMTSSSSAQQWNGQKPWNNTATQWNNRPPPQQKKQLQSQTPKKFTPFSLTPRVQSDSQKLTASAPSVANTETPGGLGVMPDNVRRYVERAYLAAQCAEDRQKVQEYLEKRLRPLLQAGTTRAVDWDREPLPHERGYELPATWTPAATLRASLQASINNNKTTVYQSKRERKRTASPSAETNAKRDRCSSGSSSDVKIVKVKSTVSKKKSKKERKRESQLAKKEKQKSNCAEKQQKSVSRWHVEEDSQRIEERARRFADDARMPTACITASAHSVRMRLVMGTCQNIEKSFFRLTTAPDPSQVRPPEVLEKSLENVKDKYRSGAPYRYLSDQLRSIRQDLTVQRVRNHFTVLVYEINARIALENKDREEFNKCQSQLKLLYHEIPDCPNEPEFVAYRLLYYIAMTNMLDISSLLKGLPQSMRSDDCVSFAMRVRRAISLGNYVTLFKLFNAAPKMCPYLMDLFVERERKAALVHILKSFRPTIPVVKVSEWLGMSESSLVEWLNMLDIECQEGGVLDCRVYATKTF